MVELVLEIEPTGGGPGAHERTPAEARRRTSVERHGTNLEIW